MFVSSLETHKLNSFGSVLFFIFREETVPKSVAPEAPKENTVRPRKRKADVAIVSSLKGLLNPIFSCS